MKSSLPSSVKVGGYNILVKMDAKQMVKENANGSYHNFVITINPSIPEQEQRSTLIHEMLEAITSIYRLSSLSESHGELSLLSEALFQVLTDNPGLLSTPVPVKRRGV